VSTLSTTICRSALALIAVAAIGVSSSAALAQSAPAPVGTWQSDSGETLVVGATCGIQANGTYGAIGSCTWDPSFQGGILTIMNVNGYKPAPVYFNVVWINGSTIQVFGDTFHRAG
jgi:hypothetical protein